MSVSQHKQSALVRGRSAALVIDGEAVVVDRVAVVKSAVARAASAPQVFVSDDPEADTGPSATPVFGRRSARFREMSRRPAEPDLFFQARSLERFAAPARRVSGGASIFMKDTAGSVPTGRRMAALGLLVLSLLVPAGILISLNPPVAVEEAGNRNVAGFVLEEVEASIVARGGGEVLAVEGLVRNLSGRPAPVPRLRIALAEPEGNTTLRPVSTSGRTLAAGGTLRFHSAVAVPPGTDGDVSVEFVSPDRPAETFDLAEAAASQTPAPARKTFDE